MDQVAPRAPPVTRKVQKRACHNACTRDMLTLHRRTGITDPNAVKALQLSSVGVNIPPAQQRRYVTSTFAKAASRWTAIRTSSVHCDPNPLAGVSASLDLMHDLVMDGEKNVCAAIFLDLCTWNLAIFPMKSKHSSEFVRVLEE